MTVDQQPKSDLNVNNGNVSPGGGANVTAQGMQKIQTKEVNSTGVRRKKLTDNALKSPSIVDLSLGANTRQESVVGTHKTNPKKNQSSRSPSNSKCQSKSPPKSKKMPNMDLIGDIHS